MSLKWACTAQDYWHVAVTETWQRGEQNRPAQLVEGKQSFSLFWIQGIFATGDDRKLLDNKHARSWAWQKKKSLQGRRCFPFTRRSLMHAPFFLIRKWQVLTLSSDMHIESVFWYAYWCRNFRKSIIRNLSRKCIWSALYVDKIVYYGCETSEITSIWIYT